ncbi:MAG: PepSY domain-containing protein [Cytophagales bacterium]
MKTKKIFDFNNWHLWIGVLLSFPIIVVGLTAILIAHKKSFDKWVINAPVLQEKYQKLEFKEIRAVANSNGYDYLATKNGLFVLNEDDEWQKVINTENAEFKQLLKTQEAIIAIGKNGLWKISGLESEKISSLESLHLSLEDNGKWVLTTKNGILSSHDQGKTWNPDSFLNESIQQITMVNMEKDDEKEGKAGIKFNKLVMDMHTGKFFTGKEYEWLWIDIVGGSLVLLTLTGLWMWVIKQKAKHKLKKALSKTELNFTELHAN